MFKFDKQRKLLIVSKKDIPDTIPVEDLLQHVKDSYADYVSYQVLEDVMYFIDTLRDRHKVPISATNLRVRQTGKDTFGKRDNFIGTEYNEVVADLINDKGITHRDTVVYRFPIMDRNGLIAGKFLVQELKRLEDISFDKAKQEVSIVYPRGVLKLQVTRQGNLRVKVNNGRNTDAISILRALLLDTGRVTEETTIDYVSRLFVSPILRRSINQQFETLDITAREVVANTIGNAATSLTDYYLMKNVSIGYAREAMNSSFTLDKALGQTLAETVQLPSGMVFPKGLPISHALLNILKKNKVTRIVITSIPNIEGRVYGKEIVVYSIKAGTTVTKKLLDRFPELEGYQFVQEDITDVVAFHKGDRIEYDDLILLHSNNVEQVFCEGDALPYTFSHEIITNNMVQIKDLGLTEEFIKGTPYRRDEFVYIPELEAAGTVEATLSDPAFKGQLQPDYRTVDDWLALVSFSAGVFSLPEIFKAYDIDEDFIKKVNDVSSTLSEAFRMTVDRSLIPSVQYFKNFMESPNEDNRKTFRTFSYKVQQSLHGRTISRPADYTNPVSLWSGPRQVTALADTPGEKQRYIVMPHYGRLDPYETPAGKKIGMTMTTPMLSKIEGNQIIVPYHPIVHRGGKYYVSQEIEYLRPLDELGKRIGDILTITTETEDMFNSPIVPTHVPAKVPAVSSSTERTSVDSIEATLLDYVTVSPEQTLGLAASLLPFIGADDGVRISYAVSMLKQSVYIQGSERPTVLTSMYFDMFQQDNQYVIRANRTGTVTQISQDMMFIDGKPLVYREVIVQGSSMTMLNLKVSEGDHVEEGQVVADTVVSREGCYTPGTNLLVAYMPYYGYNFEDAVPLSARASAKLVSIGVNTVSKEVTPYGNQFGYRNEADNENKYIKEGDMVMNLVSQGPDNLKPSTEGTVVNAPRGKSGILYNVGKTVQFGKEQFRATLVNFSNVQAGDKIVGRHGNKSINSYIVPNKDMPMFKNGVVLDILQNPCGVPSRMNIGQQLEAHLGFVAYLLGIAIQSNSFNGADISDIEILMKFVYELANAEDYNRTAMMWKGTLPLEVIAQALKRKTEIQFWAGCFDENGCAILTNQVTGEEHTYPIAFGVGYYMKLEHQVDHKIHARPGVTRDVPYTKVEKQPTRGSAQDGGQRAGEMEMDALQAYGCTEILREMLNERSDNVALREELAVAFEDNQHTPPDLSNQMRGTSTRGYELLKYYVEAASIDMDYSDGYPLDLDSVLKRVQTRPPKSKIELVVEEPSLSEEVLLDILKYKGPVGG